jgi:uncharacterized protein YunC (DUF1805 family)
MQKIRKALLNLALENSSVRPAVLIMTRQAAKWDRLPKGWTQDSVDKFWGTLTGDNKHKVTKCIKEMDGKVDDPGAFCASLADKVMGPEWRKKKKAALNWQPVTGAALDKVVRVFGAQFDPWKDRLEDLEGKLFAVKVGRKTVFARDAGDTRLYTAGDDGNIYSLKSYSAIRGISIQTLNALVDAATLGMTPEAQKEGIYTNGKLRGKMASLNWQPVTGAALDKVVRVFGAQFDPWKDRLEDLEGKLFAVKVGRKTVFARDAGDTRLYTAGDDGNIYSLKSYSAIRGISIQTLNALVEAAVKGLTPEAQKEGVYRKTVNGKLRGIKMASATLAPPRRLSRLAPEGHYQVWMSRTGDPNPYISDYPTIQVAMRQSKETANLAGVENVLIFDELGNLFKTMKRTASKPLDLGLLERMSLSGGQWILNWMNSDPRLNAGIKALVKAGYLTEYRTPNGKPVYEVSSKGVYALAERLRARGDSVPAIPKLASSTSVSTAFLPAAIKRVLVDLRFNKRKVAVWPATSFSMYMAGDDGARGFTALVDLDTGQASITMGDWGGGGLGRKLSPVDDQNSPKKPLPEHLVVVQGQQGGRDPYAVLICHPKAVSRLTVHSRKVARSAWRPEHRIMEALSAVDEAQSHMQSLAQEEPLAKRPALKASRMLDDVEQVVRKEVSEGMGISESRFASQKEANSASAFINAKTEKLAKTVFSRLKDLKYNNEVNLPSNVGGFIKSLFHVMGKSRLASEIHSFLGDMHGVGSGMPSQDGDFVGLARMVEPLVNLGEAAALGVLLLRSVKRPKASKYFETWIEKRLDLTQLDPAGSEDLMSPSDAFEASITPEIQSLVKWAWQKIGKNPQAADTLAYGVAENRNWRSLRVVHDHRGVSLDESVVDRVFREMYDLEDVAAFIVALLRTAGLGKQAEATKNLALREFAEAYAYGAPGVRVAHRHMQAFNKFNAPEVMGLLFKALSHAGLDDTVKALKDKGFARIVDEAWKKRDSQ